MISESQLVQRALRWISDKRKEETTVKLPHLLDEAGRRFNLSPMQIDSLMRLLRDEEVDEDNGFDGDDGDDD